MKTLIAPLLLAAAALFTHSAGAAEATFCRSKNTSGNPAHDTFEFSCGNGMQGTLPALYKNGWRAVGFHVHQSTDITDNVKYAVVLMEKD